MRRYYIDWYCPEVNTSVRRHEVKATNRATAMVEVEASILEVMDDDLCDGTWFVIFYRGSAERICTRSFRYEGRQLASYIAVWEDGGLVVERTDNTSAFNYTRFSKHPVNSSD